MHRWTQSSKKVITDSASSVRSAPSGEIEPVDLRVDGSADSHKDGSSASSWNRIVWERICRRSSSSAARSAIISAVAKDLRRMWM